MMYAFIGKKIERLTTVSCLVSTETTIWNHLQRIIHHENVMGQSFYPPKKV